MFESIMNILSGFLFWILHVSGVGAFPKPLSSEEESMYLEEMKKGNDDARKKLIEHNLRLVAHIIKKYYSMGYEQDDLISIGTIGLIKAVSSFDNSKGTRLATYAARCIENEILMYFRNQKKCAQDLSMSDPIEADKEGNSLTLIDVIADNSDIVDDIDIKMKSEKLGQFLNKALSKRERQIILYRYGIGGIEELTQREVAEKMKISRSYV